MKRPGRNLAAAMRSDLMAGRGADQSARQWMTRLCDASPLGIFVSDVEGHCIYTNAAYRQIAGLTDAQALGTKWSASLHPEDQRRIASRLQQALRDRQPFQAEARFLRPGGEVVWTALQAAMEEDTGEERTRLLIVEDISERKARDAALQAAEEALFAEKERAQVTLDSIGDAVMTTDLAGLVTYLNLEAESLTGWSRQDAVGRPIAEIFRIFDGETRVPAASPAQRAIEEDRTVGLAVGCKLVRRDGTEVEIEDSAAPIHDRDGRVTGAVIVFHDVAKSRAVVEKMAHLARHDFLTGLPNSALLGDKLSQAIGLAHRHRTQVALLFLDLNDFKTVNDACGHLVGDRLLQAVAHRLVACVRTTDTVCRRGGDEFVILLTEIVHHDDAAVVAEKVIAAIAEPLLIDSHSLTVGVSIGISVYPEDGDDVVTLVQRADTAMYQTKARGISGYRFTGTRMRRSTVSAEA
jgi:diguanylate cyclase (GGDEF)-like protein/PAS domain S-box-containing protein